MGLFFRDFVSKFQAHARPAEVALPSQPSSGVRKVSLRNRKHQRVVVLVDEPGVKGTAVILHGLGCSKNEADVETVSRALRDEGYTAVRFDATNGVGESDGAFRKATASGYLSDLSDVVDWTCEQPWFREPLVLVGHDMGGMCAALYAAEHPTRVARLILLAPMVSGVLSYQTLEKTNNLSGWKRFGSMIWESQSRPGLIRRLDWAHMEDRLRYDLLPEAVHLRMPVLHVAHEKDKLTPVEHQEMLHQALPGSHKAWYILMNAHHRLRHESHFQKLYELIRLWLREGKLPSTM